ncbi:MAG: spondin domain-containing protein [Pseudomonadota bacterium]
MANLRFTVRNTADAGGAHLSAFRITLHGGEYDPFNRGQPASPGFERFAEDDNSGLLAQEWAPLTGADRIDRTTGGTMGPYGVSTIEIFSLPGTTHLTLLSKILPSNDAFIGTDDPIRLFDDQGVFLGPTKIQFDGSDVMDAGTELNTEVDAFFLNQSWPLLNTGVSESGVVAPHPGFNGSVGNPETGFDQNILGGFNSNWRATFDPVAADFTRPGAQIAEVYVNTYAEFSGTGQRDVHRGTSSDDMVQGEGGKDIIYGKGGRDSIDGGNGRDILFGGLEDDVLRGGEGNDKIFGGAGNDIASGGDGWDVIFGEAGDDGLEGGGGTDQLYGGAGADQLIGGAYRDHLYGGIGDDTLMGGEGNDRMSGGAGADTFFIFGRSGKDLIQDFNPGADMLVFLESRSLDPLANARQVGDSVRIDYAAGSTDDFVMLRNVNITDLSADNFDFV